MLVKRFHDVGVDSPLAETVTAALVKASERVALDRSVDDRNTAFWSLVLVFTGRRCVDIVFSVCFSG